MTLNKETDSKHNSWLYWVIVFCAAVVLLHASSFIGFMNQGDFPRAVGGFLTVPLDSIALPSVLPFGYVWPFLESIPLPSLKDGSSVVWFWLMAQLQRVYSPYFDIFTMALVAKVYWLMLLHVIASRLTLILNWGALGQLTIFGGLSVACFAAHNVALLNSFYTEYVFFLSAPLLLLAATSACLQKRRLWYAALALLAGSAKVQFFYVPTLLLFCLVISDLLEKRQIDKGLTTILVLIQIVCLIPFGANQFTQINRYHATYLGSYMVLSDSELAKLGLDERRQKCVGIDAHGNQLASPSATHYTSGFDHCYKLDQQKLSDVLVPYVLFPDVALRLWKNALVPHFTVQYFHVSKELPFTVPTNGRSYRTGQWLVEVTALRDRWISRNVLLLIVASGLVLPFLYPRRAPHPLRVPSLFLSLFMLTQILISVLGEGVRDLSRHLSAAQFGLDLLLIVCALQMVLLSRRWRSTEVTAPIASSP